jgi:hypothetical protein
LNSPPPLLSFTPSLPVPVTVSTGVVFAFIHYWHHIHPPTPFPATSLLPPIPTPSPSQNLFYLPVFRFCRRKNIKDKKRNMVFLLVGDKDNYTGMCSYSLWCLHAYVYYNPNCFISSSALHSSLVPFPWWLRPG